MAQVSHGPHPGKVNIIQLTQSGDGLCNGRISIAGKEHMASSTVFQCFFQLLGTYHDLAFGKLFTHLTDSHNYIILSVHTVYYYILVFEKVNIFFRKNSTFSRKFWTFFVVIFHHFPLFFRGGFLCFTGGFFSFSSA